MANWNFRNVARESGLWPAVTQLFCRFAVGREFKHLAAGVGDECSGTQDSAVTREKYGPIGGFSRCKLGWDQSQGGRGGARFEARGDTFGQRALAASLIAVGGLHVFV